MAAPRAKGPEDRSEYDPSIGNRQGGIAMFQGLRSSHLLAPILLGAVVAQAQELPPSTFLDVPDALNTQVAGQPLFEEFASPAMLGFGPPAESLQAEIAEDIIETSQYSRRFGPTPVDDVRFLMDDVGLADWFGDSGIRAFGWLEGGYTYSSAGSGLNSVQPRQNRFGNEFILNQMALVVQKPLKQDEFDLGFNVRYFAGADPALGQPLGGLDSPPDSIRFSHDFRDLSLNAHLPILTEGGMDVKVGRMNTIIGSNGFLAPYRPFYSSDYQFAFSQDGAFTGFLTCLHVNDQLNIWNGMTLGANTFFTRRRSDSYCYIGQINYWLQPDKRTCFTASAHVGPNAINAAPGMVGEFVTIAEFRVLHHWNELFRQVVQTNMGWDQETAVGTGQWYGLYTVGALSLNKHWDALTRIEWFRDVRGTRTGFDTHYAEVTCGLNWHPNPSLEFRPEIRGDFAGAPAFGSFGQASRDSQLTAAMSVLIKF